MMELLKRNTPQETLEQKLTKLIWYSRISQALLSSIDRYRKRVLTKNRPLGDTFAFLIC